MKETGLTDIEKYRFLLIERISSRELDVYLRKCNGRVILPVGSIEPHASIFPLGTDKIIAENLSIELAKELYRQGKCALIAPVISYGISVEWKKSNSTITLSIPTMHLLLKDILSSLREIGFRIIIIINAHGGNSEIIRLISRELTENFSDIEVIVVDWWRVVSDVISKHSSAGVFMHSDEIETSMLLYWGIIDRKLISERNIVKKRKFPWQKRNGVEAYKSITREQTLAAYGDPSKASTKLGENLVKEFCRRVAEVIE